MKKKRTNIFLLAIFLFYVIGLLAQKTNFNPVLDAFDKNNYLLIKEELKKIDTLKINYYDKATWYYYYADYNYRLDKHHIAYRAIQKSKNIFIKLEKEKDIIDCNILLLGILSHQNNLDTNSKTIIDELTDYALKKNDTLILKEVYYRLAVKSIDIGNVEESIKYFKKIIAIATIQKDTLQIANTTMNIGSVYNMTNPVNVDSALYYTKKAEPFFIKYKANLRLSYNYNNQGNMYKNAKNYKKAISYFKKADSIPLGKFKAKTKVVFYENMADAYSQDKQYKNATIYYKKQIALQDSINDTQQNIAIADIQTKYETEAKEKEILLKEKENKKIKNIVILLGISLFLGSIIAFLQNINSKRKQRISEQDQQLAKQKVTNLLKEQELIAIDAMIEGQEKERQLIASDLHDDLGALMATLQLNFENLDKHKNSKDSKVLFARIKSLISEAYQKIRKIAHAKNSGVIAKQGLLKAIKNNAYKISQLNSIEIDVREHGLENRLDNSLELTLFRIVQELLTNIIKHADATQVTIHFTNHENLLNIMVEDNGKGFDTKSISKSEGIGIQSIEKRVEALEGSMAIESIIGKGTTIILDIPL